MSNQNTVNGLIRNLDSSNPDVYSALQAMSDDLYRAYNSLFPSEARARNVIAGGISSTLAGVTGFYATLFSNNLRLNWDVTSGAFQYEIRKGSSWDTAQHILTTSSQVADLDPITNNLVAGSYTFLIKSININGEYTVNATSVGVTVAAPSAPTVTATPISNNVVLRWTAPSSTWAIAYYKVLKGGVEIERVTATGDVIVESLAGTYLYSIQAVDIVGNLGTPSPNISVAVTSPIDFTSVGNFTAALTGTYTNCFRDNVPYADRVTGAVNSTETYQQHFVNNAWATPDAQIAAGFPRWLSPDLLSGSYRESFDLGISVSNSIITAVWNQIQLFGTTTVSIGIETSTDNISWTPATVSGAIAFVSISFRYVRVTWTFTNADTLSLCQIYGLKCLVDVQLSMDSGNGTANSGDSGGTTVTFNKTYKLVNSVTITTNTLQPVTAIYTNVTTTNFKILIFDSTGNRITLPFSWKARGII